MAKKLLSLIVALALTVSCSFGLFGCEKGGTSSTADKLDSTTAITYENGSLSWNAVTGADSYGVKVTKGSETVKDETTEGTTLSVADLGSGDYTAAVIAKGEGKTDSDAKSYSFTIEEVQLSALATPTDFNYAEDKITWGAVSGATSGYTVKIDVKNGENVVAETAVTELIYDVSALAAGEYTISVYANAVEGTALKSNTATFDFTVASKLEKLATPSNGAIDAENRKVTWGAVENATGYLVSVTKNAEVLIAETEVSVTELNVSRIEEDEFTVNIAAVGGENTEKSEVYEYSAKVTAIALSAVTNVTLSEDQTVLSWDEVASSDEYRIIIKDGEQTVCDEAQIETELDVSSYSSGEYAVEIYAIADIDDIFRSDSEKCEYTMTIDSLGAFEDIGNLTLSGGKVKWGSTNAKGFEVVVRELNSDQNLSLNGIVAKDNGFLIAGLGLSKGDYTVSITPCDNRHETEQGTTKSIDITIKIAASFTAEDIAAFSGNAPVGEHASVTTAVYNGATVAKVTPTADGWGRIGSSSVTVDYDSNPILFVDIKGLEIGGFHAQVQIGGTNYDVLSDKPKVEPTAVSLSSRIASVTGTKATIIRLGVDNSSTTAANDAVAYYNSCSILYISEYDPNVFQGQLDDVAGYAISNGMEIAWNAVENADSYNVTLKDNDTNEIVCDTAVQNSISYSVKELAAGNYRLEVSAFCSDNELAIKSETTYYAFKVEVIKNYSAQEISTFTNVMVGDNQDIYYDETNGTAIYNHSGDYGYGAIGPNTGISINLTNQPFVVIDVVTIDYGYLMRAKWTPDGGSTTTLVIANDTPTTVSNKKLYIELWKQADKNGAAVYGTGSYSFGMGFLAGSNNGTVEVRSMEIKQVTPIEVLVPGARNELDAPSGMSENKGEISASTVSGNTAYTPTYATKITAKGSETAIYEANGLVSPCVLFAGLSGLTSGVYTVSFKAEGDDNYFVDSQWYSADITYTEIYSLTEFTSSIFNSYTMGDSPVLSVESNELCVTVNNGAWGLGFIDIDLSDVLSELSGSYMQWNIDMTATTSGANIATRFKTKAGEYVGTGHGDQTVSQTYLTKEWSDKVSDAGIVTFGIGHGGGTYGEGTTKAIVVSSIKFIKLTVNG